MYYSKTQVFLGNYPARRFTEAVPLGAINKFQDKLKEITAQIIKRNETLDVPYVNMLPSKIPNSITI